MPDFVLEDVWALPAHGGREDFQTLLDLMGSSEPVSSNSLPTRVLWHVRDLLVAVSRLGRTLAPGGGGGEDSGRLPIPGTSETSLAGRLPEDLRGTVTGGRFGSLPFEPVYRTDDEFAAELSTQTVHAVMHLAWADQGNGRYQGQMAVYVKPRGRLGQAYMALIKPFRYTIVYPALMRRIERTWDARGA